MTGVPWDINILRFHQRMISNESYILFHQDEEPVKIYIAKCISDLNHEL